MCHWLQHAFLEQRHLRVVVPPYPVGRKRYFPIYRRVATQDVHSIQTKERKKAGRGGKQN